MSEESTRYEKFQSAADEPSGFDRSFTENVERRFLELGSDVERVDVDIYVSTYETAETYISRESRVETGNHDRYEKENKIRTIRNEKERNPREGVNWMKGRASYFNAGPDNAIEFCYLTTGSGDKKRPLTVTAEVKEGNDFIKATFHAIPNPKAAPADDKKLNKGDELRIDENPYIFVLSKVEMPDPLKPNETIEYQRTEINNDTVVNFQGRKELSEVLEMMNDALHESVDAPRKAAQAGVSGLVSKFKKKLTGGSTAENSVADTEAA